ncbi:MAG: ABC transporter permease [Actinomycetota bacterium]
MTWLRRVAAALTASSRRLRRQPATTALLIVGLVAPVAVSVAVPVYADSASGRLFAEQIGEVELDRAGRDPLAALLSFNRLSGGARSWAEIEEFDEIALDPPGLPLGAIDRFVETVPLTASVGDERLGSVTFASVTGWEQDIELVDGRVPAPAAGGAGAAEAPIEILVEAIFAEENGLGVEQRVDLVVDGATFAVEVVGVWGDTEAADAEGGTPVGTGTGTVSGGEAANATVGMRPTAPFGAADAFRRRLLVPHTTIVDVVSPRLDDGIQNVRWRLALDPDGFGGDDVPALLAALDRLSATAERLVPGTRETSSPAGALRRFAADERALRDGLASFSAPLLVLSIAVGSMLVAVVTRTRLPEFRSLRRRGTSRRSLVAAQLPDAVVIAAVATVLGVAGGVGLASLIGRTETFFRFGGLDDLDLTVDGGAWTAAARAGLLLLLIQLVPLVALLARLGGRQDAPSVADRPWYQRANLDLVAVLVVAVVTWRGVTGDRGRSELLDDPAIVLLPSAAAVAGGLVLLRVVPIVMAAVARLLERTDRSAALVAARRAARVPADLAAPLLLLVVTATLATFTASLATTLDLQLADESLHRIGGVARITDTGRQVPASVTPPSTEAAVPNPPRNVVEHADLDAYSRVWGVRRASPSIELVGSGRHAGGEVEGVVFRGIEPVSFAEVSYWRDDFAERSLVDLMSELVERPDAVLADRALLAAEGLEVGDSLELDLVTSSGGLRWPVVVAGAVDQFPGWYPGRQAPLVVGRADVVEALSGATHDRDVVVEVDERFGDRTRVVNDLLAFGASRPTVSAAALAIEQGRGDPGRQGVLGLLTVGVAVAAMLTVIGFVVSTVGSLRRRTTELGVLRAMGMTRREVTTMALFDLGSVMTLGLLASLVLGVGFSRWFIPLLVDTPPGAAPDLRPAVAWSAISTLAVALVGLLAIAAGSVVAALRRIRLYEAIRLGEGDA